MPAPHHRPSRESDCVRPLFRRFAEVLPPLPAARPTLAAGTADASGDIPSFPTPPAVSLGGQSHVCAPHSAHQDCYDSAVISPAPEQAAEEPHEAVLARVKQAILEDDRSGALALLHILLTDGPETAATLTPVLAQALIATARTEQDADDQRARRSFDEAHAARTQVCRLLRSAPLDSDDLAAIRAALEDRERELDHELELRLADHRDSSTPSVCGSGLAGSNDTGLPGAGGRTCVHAFARRMAASA
jgi:hypothetical protein